MVFTDAAKLSTNYSTFQLSVLSMRGEGCILSVPSLSQHIMIMLELEALYKHSGSSLVWKPASHIAERESGDLLIPNWFWWNVWLVSMYVPLIKPPLVTSGHASIGAAGMGLDYVSHQTV